MLLTIALPTVNKTVVPDFGFRAFGFYYNAFFEASADEALWQLRLGLNWRGGLGGHGIRGVIAHPKTQEEHPEYYLLVGGKRDTMQRNSGAPCLSSEGLMQSNIEYAKALFDIYGADNVSVMPTDGYSNLCQCDLCKGKDTPDRGSEGKLSDYVWGYVNEVAKALYKTNPDKKVDCYAYSSYLLPPEKIDQLSPNIVVGICQWRSNFHNPEVREKFLKLRQDWLAKLPTKQLHTWDYYLHGRPGRPYEGLPTYFPRIISEDLRALNGICAGEGMEVYRSPDHAVPDPALAVNHVNCYVTARLWWDADEDVDALLNEYYANFYGPAAEAMKAFIEYSEANWPKMMNSVEPIDEAHKLMNAAREAAGDTIYGKRVALVADYTKPLSQLRERLTMGRTNVPRARAMHRHGVPITIDGKLDEKFWEGIYAYPMRDLVTGKALKNPTDYRIGWTDKGFYFGIVCHDEDMKNLHITATEDGDTNIWTGDSVEILLETQTHSYYQIAISPSGALVDVDRKNGVETRWSSQAEVATHLGEDYWSVEVFIPLAGEMQEEVLPLQGVSGRIPSDTFPWFFNVCRSRSRVEADERELSAFSPTGTATFHDRMKFASMTTR